MAFLNERNEEKFFKDLELFASEIRKRNDFVVIFHHDADGVSSGAIAITALKRENKKLNYLCLKQLYKENIEEIKALGKNYLFVDFGSGQLDYLKEDLGEENVFVIDHHQPLKENGIEIEMKWHINPLLYGIDGGKELSGAGATFFFALALNKKNSDLSSLAIIGALGDMQDFTGKLVGINRKILQIAQTEKLISKKIDLRLYGRISRPLVSYLMFSTSPILPNLTASQDNCISFFKELGIEIKDHHGNYKSYEDLKEEEKRKLSTALIMHLNDFNTPDWKIKEMIGEIYTLEKEIKKSPLRDAKEFATVLNACARNKKYNIALAVCLGDRNPFGEYGKALSMLQIHRENLRAGIEFVQKNGIEEKKSFYFFDARGEIDESIVGVIAGMLYGGTIEENKPIIALAENEDGTIKISARATSTLLKRGINLGLAFKELSKEIEGMEGGGHCLHPDTLIQKNNGEIQKISEVGEKNYLLSKFNNDLINSKCSKVFVSKKKKIISFKTKNTEIISSDDHRFFKFENFNLVEIKAKDLKEKDFILGVKKIRFTGDAVKLENNPFVYLKKEGINLLKNKRLKIKLSRKELARKIPSFKNKVHHITDIEAFKSHRLIENSLIEYISALKISKKYFYSNFIEKKFNYNSNKLNSEISWLLGYIQGDGNIGKKRIEAKEPDEKILEKFEKAISKNFSLKSTLVDMGTYKKIRVYSADSCRFFEKNFPESKLLSGNLKVPKKIMISKNTILASYISGLFDAEGCVYDRFISIQMVDKYLLKTIQLLLLRFGIKSNFREVKYKKEIKGKKQFILDITDFDSIKLFKKEIGFVKGGKKNILLKKVINKQSKKKRNSMLFSPITYGFARKFIKDNNIPKKIFGTGILYKRTNSKRMNYISLNKYFINPILKNKKYAPINALEKINWLNKIVNGKYFTFYEIKTKNYLGEKSGFFDLSIPKTKNFMANGLVVHNSIAAGLKLPKEKKEEFLLKLEKKLLSQLNENKF